MDRLYVCITSDVLSCACDYKIKEEKPNLLKAYPNQNISIKTAIQNLYWWMMTKGKYRVYCVYDGTKLIHTSYLIPQCSKFPFLTRDSYEIGPCQTDYDYRGKGIYPAVLTDILKNKIGGAAYMIISEKNTSSIRGVTKVGFKRMPGYVRRDRLKRYNYEEE